MCIRDREYTFEEISQLIAGGAEAHSPAYWDLYLFLNEWFKDVYKRQGQRGFVIAPFQVSETCPVVLIQPDQWGAWNKILTKPESMPKKPLRYISTY